MKQDLLKELVGKSLTKQQQEEQVCADRATILSNFLKQALQKYSQINKKLPTTIAIYRDGVGGPSYEDKVIRNEEPAVSETIRSV